MLIAYSDKIKVACSGKPIQTNPDCNPNYPIPFLEEDLLEVRLTFDLQGLRQNPETEAV
jgi:hypothetical protein